MALGKLYADAAKIDCTGVAAATDMDTKVIVLNLFLNHRSKKKAYSENLLLHYNNYTAIK